MELLKPDEITALEYTSLKVPYELFNKRFRSSQKTVEKNNHYLKESSDLVAKAMKGDGTIPTYKLHVRFQFFNLSNFQNFYFIEMLHFYKFCFFFRKPIKQK